MNEEDRIKLVRSVARLSVAASRAAAIREMSACLGIDGVLVFTADAEVGAVLLAPSFVQTLPAGESWQGFLKASLAEGRHSAVLPLTKGDAPKSVTGLGWDQRAVLALVGTRPAEDVLSELVLLLPLLAVAFCHERGFAVQEARAQLADQVARDSAVLTTSLDRARRGAQKEIIARKIAEKALRLVRDELTQANIELTAARDRAVAGSTAKDDFLAALSHELRTPLNPVLLLASDGANNPELPAQVRLDFATITKNAQLEARLIDDLLDLTHIVRGKINLEKQRVDLRLVLQDATSNVRADLDAKKIDFVLALAPGEHAVICDPARLQQVFWNVLKNAVKFTPTGGSIRVDSQIDTQTANVVVVITDTGIGMTAPEVERAFKAFSQGDHAVSSHSHRFGGLGLGLAISCELVRLHGGTIQAASAGRERGATFTICLPLAQPVAAQTMPEPESSAEALDNQRKGSSPQRVLLVEDHEATSAALARLLSRRNYDVVVAATVAEAVNAAESREFDLVISDIGLPDGDGYSLMESLGRQHGIPGIAVTGYGMQEDIARSKAAGFTAHLTKPVSVRALERALETLRTVEQTSE